MKIEIDGERFEVRAGGKEVKLTLVELKILSALIAADGKVLSRDEIRKVYGAEWNNLRVADQHVSRIRKNLGPAGKKIVTVFGVGYKLARA